jgi:isopropylmalate/homocitrate/citramalate synthase
MGSLFPILPGELEFDERSAWWNFVKLACKVGEDYAHRIKVVREIFDAYEDMEIIDYAKAPGLPTGIGIIDTMRAEMDDIRNIYRGAVEAGADRVWVYDTFGIASPQAIALVTKEIKKVVNVPIVVHCHNDFGLAVANTLSAISAGAEHADLVMNGYGDRGGNASLEEAVCALEILYGVDTGIELSKIYEASKELERLSGIRCQVHKPLVGKNAFTETSESHVYALLRRFEKGKWDPGWETISPEIIGRRHEIAWSMATLRGEALKLKMEQMGISPSPDKIEKLREALRKEFAEKTYLTDEELE